MSEERKAFRYPRGARRLGAEDFFVLIFDLDSDGKIKQLWKKDNDKIDPSLADEAIKQVYDLPLKSGQPGLYKLCLDFKLNK